MAETPDDDAIMVPIIEYLATLGVTPEDVPASPSDAPAYASDVVLSRPDQFSLREVAARIGGGDDEIRSQLEHLGLLIDDDETVMFGEADVELARFLEVTAPMLTADETTELLHVAGTSLSAIAEAAVSGYVQGAESRSLDWLDNTKLNVATTEVGLELAPHLATAFRHHLRQAALRQRRTQSVTHREVRNLSVGFVDLVGFTSLSQTLEPDKIVALIVEFERRAHELAHAEGTRVVKLIGDEVMFVAEFPMEAARFAIGMLDAFGSGEVIPRGGLASGPLVTVHGDFFGPVVNLAARLVDTAVPGEILVDDAVAAGCDHVTEPAGRRMLKGFDQPVKVHSLLSEEAR